MEKTKWIFLAVVALSLTTIAASAELTVTNTTRDEFKTLVHAYFHPVVNGWGIAWDTADNYKVAKFTAVSVKTLPRDQVLGILQQARADGVNDWTVVRQRIAAAIEANGTTITVGRIKIDDTHYLLGNIVKSDTSVSADIKTMPNFENCKTQNITLQMCEANAPKVGDISVTKKKDGSEGDPAVWAGTMDLNGVAYTFVALSRPVMS